MSVEVKLSDVVAAFEEVGDGTFQYLDKRTGEIIFLTEDDFSAAESDELVSEFPDWQRESILKAREVLKSDESDEIGDYVALPEKFDSDEYAIMEDFCSTYRDRQTGNELLRLSKGSGAFRRFKDAIDALGLDQQWFAHRQEKFTELAIEWLAENGIAYNRDDEIKVSGQTM
jgi:Uncharacterised protein family (UPF0158)